MKTETDVNKRWMQGIDHHPKSMEIVGALMKLDLAFGGDSFCLKIGGDGDNGEHLMFLLDIYFEAKDCGELAELWRQADSEFKKQMDAAISGLKSL